MPFFSSDGDAHPVTGASFHGLAADIKVGQGRFTLKRILGQGGMGMVWLARDSRLDEFVALKFLPPQLRSDPAGLANLRREALRSRKLTHPNIVRIHDLHEPAGEESFIAMEYVNGATLSVLRLAQSGEVFHWEALAGPAKQLCDALDYAHGEGVIHRDLKPSNLMLDNKGRMKLADFGIATIINDSIGRLSGRIVGTPAYMSPQQINGKFPEPTDDIYSLGATVYELLTGTPPFCTGQILHQVLHNEAMPVQQRLAQLNRQNAIPGHVESLIMACLAKEPAQRPQSARAVSDWIGLPPSMHPRSLEATITPPEQEPYAAPTGPFSRRIVWSVSLIFVLTFFGIAGWLVNSKAKASRLTSAPARGAAAFEFKSSAGKTKGGLSTPITENDRVDNPARNIATQASNLLPATPTSKTRERLLLAEDFERFSPGIPINETYRKGVVLTENGEHFLRIVGDIQTNRHYVFFTELPVKWKQLNISCRIRARNLKLNFGSQRTSGVFLNVALYDGQSKAATYLRAKGRFYRVKEDTDWVLQSGTFDSRDAPASKRKLHISLLVDHASGFADFDDLKVMLVED